MILAGDIGGTKTVLALFKQEKDRLLCLHKQTYLCAEYQSLGQILAVFHEQAMQPNISSACLGIAGPIVNGDCYTTTPKWNITCRKISEILTTDNIYQFLKQSGFLTSPVIEDAFNAGDPPAIIGEAGTSGSDASCQEALAVFCRIYGAEAGNMALKCLPYGGVYLAGGIAPKILPMLQKDFFMQRFLNKGRYRNILKKIPVRACLNPEAGLLGAHEKALAMIH
jgi:glucokinase